MAEPLPALLVAEVDSLAAPELAMERNQTLYLCLSADNRHTLPSLHHSSTPVLEPTTHASISGTSNLLS